MKIHFILFMLLSLSLSMDVKKADQCVCAKIAYLADCKAATGCAWDTTQSTCSSSTVTPVDTTQTYCSIITDSAQCAKTRTCAYLDSECKPFAGCSAYLGASNIDCQAIHQWCNSDGTYCVEPTACSTYKTQTDCTEKSSSSGSGTCIWETTCRDQKCTEASTELITDLACSQFISTCVTTGKGCVTAPLSTCSTFSGDATVCQGLKGSDGLCEGTETGTKCSAKDCKNAPGDTSTNDDCAAYQIGCITNGKGCLKTLTACASYSTQGSAEFCVGLIGSDGVCEYDTGTKCKLLGCESASDSLNNDDDCNSYRTGCYTTGKGCITTRGNCSSYKGTTATCEGYIGSDGNCKGTNETTASACTPRLCQDADSSLNTDDDCKTFQKGCLTTGKGCSSNLGACSSYTGDSSSCDGYVGSDGKCKGGVTSGPCSPKVCSEAATTLTTNEECAAYQKNCVTQPSGGCILAGSCPALFKQLSCGGLSTCQWNNLCVANATCGSFTTQGICNENLTKDSESCFWDVGSSPNCRIRQCTDAPNTTNSDSDCNTFLKDCWTNGAGCFAQSTSCTAYKGTKSTCEAFTRKCTNVDAAIATTACVEVNCTDNTTATSDGDCITFKKGCLTKGTGCTASTQPCNTYSGTQEECDKFTGNSIKCWNTGSSGACMDKLCSHAPATVANDGECSTFLTGCLFKGTGAGCIESTAECTAYTGTSTACATFVGNSKKCHKTDSCADRICSDKSSAVDQADCANYKPSCRYLKGACVDANTCSNYGGTQLSECQDVLDSSSNKCWWTTSTSCTDRTCLLSPNKSNNSDCDTFKTGCVYAKNASGSAICITKGNCNTYYGTPDECKGFKNGSDVLCWSTASGTSSVQCSDRACNLITDLTTESSCTNHLASCIINRPASGNVCVDKTSTACASLQGTDVECKAMTGSDGQCWTGAQTGTNKAACVLRICTQITSPGSIDACSNHLATCTRTAPTTSGTYACITNATACTALKGTQEECKALVGASAKCWKAVNSYGVCDVRDCTTAPSTNNDADCISHLDSCRFTYLSAGSSTKKCISLPASCASYFETPDNCKTMKAYTASADVLCWSSTSGSAVVACSNRACGDLGSPTSDADCKSHMPTCRLSQPGGGNVCITQGLCSTYTGTPTQCQSFTGTDGNCWPVDSTVSSAAICKVRTCNMNTTAQTDAECNTFFTGCKTTGRGCIDPATACGNLSGTATSCNSLISSTVNVYCKAGTGSSSNCQVRICFDNGDATTDADCDSFLKGCITKGKGCVPSTTPCSNFIGNQTSCGALTGNSIKCWSLSTTTSDACIDRLCEHNTTATSDASCDEFLKGCLTKGTGCIDPTKSCTSYAGVTATCEKYKGSSQTKTCTNDATASSTTSCKEKDCTKNTTATSDAECNSYGIHCVYKGQTGGCQTKGLCAQMKGNIVSCAAFTASDGPCKGSVDVGKTDAACAARVCSEAPNNLDTDEKCKAYHPTCLTNGYGCSLTVACGDFQGSEACGLKTGCAWTGQCRNLETNCNTYTALGASICKNAVVSTGMKSCAWKNNACNAMTCEDLPATISTEDDCVAQSNTCTYKGEGCITKGVCTSYKTEAICISAKATDGTGNCAWDSATGCRTKICSDSIGDTNEKCEAFITGCKTNGVGCVQSDFTCSQIQTKGLCINDGTGLPCLWVLEKCYQYQKCSDIAFTTHSDCQKVNKFCTTDDTKCIAFDQCAAYKKQSSCITGTDGSCGWTPAKKCQLFTACTDVTGTTNDVCQVYNSACITDGKACVEQGECSSYLTDVACNKGGTDGLCYWDKSGTTCRLRECSDSTSNNKTHTGCYAYTASTKCTTTGTACIPLDTCSAYTTQAGCVLGTDGTCSWSTTAKSCKLKDCTDIKKTKTADCIKEMSTCVSNGTNCVALAACATYTSKTACNSGGLNNEICAFTPSSSGSSTGTCKIMSSCADASSDQASCTQYSTACKWTAATTTASSVCAAQTCESLAKGTVCNPIPSFDGLSYSVCILQGGKCVLGDPSALTSDVCFRLSALTYSWDSKNNKCVSCGVGATDNTNTTNTTTTTNNTQTTTGRGEIINLGSLFLLMALLE